MGVQASRIPNVPPISDRCEGFELPALQKLVREMEATVNMYFKPGASSTYESVHDVTIRCIKSASKVYGAEEARKDAVGFEWDPIKLASDMAAFVAADYSITTMALTRQDIHRPHRLNLGRLSSLSADNPESEHLRSLCGGIIVPKPEGYRPNAKCFREIKEVLLMQRTFCQWTNCTHRREDSGIGQRFTTVPAAEAYSYPLHRSYRDTFPAIDKMLSDLHDKGLGFNLPKAVLFSTDSVHLSQLKHTPKADTVSGRTITDLTWGVPPILNGDFAAEWAAEMYGNIVHPTILDVVLMILDTVDKVQLADPLVDLGDLCFWKVDISGAFNWLDFLPSDVHCMAQELANGRVFLSLVGVFGASILPFAFNVISKAFRHEVKKTTRGGADIYSDDGFGCCLLGDLGWEMETACTIFENMIGENCIKKAKNVSGRVVNVIGWKINLDLMVVSIAEKNLMKAMLCMFEVNLDAEITLVAVQRISSYCSRYVLILEVMTPFLACMHRLMTGKKGWHGTFPITSEAAWAIRMWRAVFYLLVVDEKHYGRPMASFRSRPPDYIVETDASLSGVGVILYRNNDSLDTCVGGSAVSIKDFGFGTDSGFQNTAEYIGTVLGVLALVKIGVRDVDVLIRGDSTTALVWATQGKVKGPAAINAAVVVTALCIRFGIRPRYSVFLSGLENHKADLLSRVEEKGISVEQAMNQNGHGGSPIINLRENATTNTLVQMCDPRVKVDKEEEFALLWQTVREAMESFS
jgi:hypothetical protein